MGLLAEFSSSLLDFAIRLYTRLHPKPGTTLSRDPFMVVFPNVIRHIDNGERSIIVEIKYGPKWHGDFDD